MIRKRQTRVAYIPAPHWARVYADFAKPNLRKKATKNAGTLTGPALLCLGGKAIAPGMNVLYHQGYGRGMS